MAQQAYVNRWEAVPVTYKVFLAVHWLLHILIILSYVFYLRLEDLFMHFTLSFVYYIRFRGLKSIPA